MENFYKKIKDKISITPDVSTDWKMWDDIEQTLEKKKKNRFLPIFLALPFLILLSGYIGYLLAPNPNALFSTIAESQRDTIYITKSINTVDTIVKTEYLTRWKYRNPNQNIQLLSQINSLTNTNQSLLNNIDALDTKLNDYRFALSESVIKNNPKYQHLDFFETESITSASKNNSTTITERILMGRLDLSPLLYPKRLYYKRPQIMLSNDQWFENLVKKNKSKNLFEQIVPDYVNIGLSSETPGLAFTNNLSPGLESGFGLNTEFLFSPKFSFVSGVRKRATQNKTSDETIASTYPQPIVTPEESFKNLKVKSSFIDIPFSFKYKVFKHMQNDIYFTGGLLLSKQQQTEYVYEYIRNSSEIYYEEKEEGGNWNLGSTIFGIGYEIDTWKNTSAFIESYARYNFNSDSYAVHGMGFRFGMFYKI